MDNINSPEITLGKDDGTVTDRKIVCCAGLLIDRGKKSNFMGFLETNFSKKMADFMGIFWENFAGNQSVLL